MRKANIEIILNKDSKRVRIHATFHDSFSISITPTTVSVCVRCVTDIQMFRSFVSFIGQKNSCSDSNVEREATRSTEAHVPMHLYGGVVCR